MRALLVVVLFVWTGMHIYVFWRTSSVPLIARRMRRNLLWSVAAILWITYIAARILNHWGLRVPAQILEVVGAYWIGLFFW